MTTRASTTIKTQVHAQALAIEWAGLTAGDVGDWVLLGHYADKCLHVYGVVGGAVVTLEGTNEDISAGSSYSVPLNDTLQNPIAINVTGMRQVLENPLYVRPVISGGDGTTAIAVRLVCRP